MKESQKTALVLGGTFPHISLIDKLKVRGYHTVLVDYCLSPPAAEIADEHVQISTLDKEAVLSIARNKNVKLIITSCVDQANSVCCYVSEKLGLPRPYSYKTSIDATDKGRMKELFQKGGMRTSDYCIVSSPKEICCVNMPFPLVVKPVDANSSKGVHRANNIDELYLYVEEALNISKAGHAIIEEFCFGVEIQVDCLAVEGKAKVLLTRSKNHLPEELNAELNSTGSVVPALLCPTMRDETERIAQQICDCFELNNTPFFYQAMVYDNNVSLLEFAPRIGGGLSTELVKLATNVDLIECSIRSYLGESLKDIVALPVNRMYSTCLLYMKQGIFDRIEGTEALLCDGTVDRISIYKRSGEIISSELSSNNRIAALILSGSSLEEINTKTTRALESIEIFNSEGRGCMIKQSSHCIESGGKL